MFEKEPKIKFKPEDKKSEIFPNREQKIKELFDEKVRLIDQIKQIKQMSAQEELFSEKRIPYEALIESIQKRLPNLEAEIKKLNSRND